jgi:uncharacterized protein YqjF (DUF2071 family)
MVVTMFWEQLKPLKSNHMSFLTAEWRKLVFVNYEIDPEILQPYVPYGTELDLWQGKCYVSLIGFMFLNTRLRGVKVPFHVNFEEVNLRFYVKRQENGEWKRGVVFIKEIVPRPAIVWVANTLYGEQYETRPMRHQWRELDKAISISYSWKHSGKWFSLRAVAEREAKDMEPGSETEFITEHYWGYAKSGATRTNEYEVTHPRWQVYKVLDYDINVDFQAVYGNNFGFLNARKPTSVMLAEGSAITIEGKRSIKM